MSILTYAKYWNDEKYQHINTFLFKWSFCFTWLLHRFETLVLLLLLSIFFVCVDIFVEFKIWKIYQTSCSMKILENGTSLSHLHYWWKSSATQFFLSICIDYISIKFLLRPTYGFFKKYPQIKLFFITRLDWMHFCLVRDNIFMSSSQINPVPSYARICSRSTVEYIDNHFKCYVHLKTKYILWYLISW